MLNFVQVWYEVLKPHPFNPNPYLIWEKTDCCQLRSRRRFDSYGCSNHYSDAIIGAMASQITSLAIVYSTVYFRRRSKKTSKLRVTGLFVGNSPVTGELPTQRASNAENVSIWWRNYVNRHHWSSIFPKSLLRFSGVRICCYGVLLTQAYAVSKTVTIMISSRYAYRFCGKMIAASLFRVNTIVTTSANAY